jgi:myo-inositol 2-dehydrogenase/D-chiro-inositol 1-dehydrogenase
MANEEQTTMSKQRSAISRRRFIQASAAAAAGFSIVPRRVLGGVGFTPPSEQPTRAVIGCGGMGTGHIKSINTEARLMAVCDVDEAHLSAGVKNAQAGGNADVKGYKDWREVIDRADIDIIHIPTPPHWHALMSIAAAQAGKDIWCGTGGSFGLIRGFDLRAVSMG